MGRIHNSHCPVCGSADIAERLKAADHTVTGEIFQVYECRQCTLRFTQDVPDEISIAPYYKSADYISHTETAKGAINRLYHIIRKHTLAQKRKLIQKATGLSKGRLLDIGSGTGAFLNEMKNAGWQIAGLEPDEGARKLASQLYNIQLGEISGFYQLQAGAYDAITLWHVLEHVHDLQGYLHQLKLLLAGEGKLFIALPNYTAADAAAYQEFWAAYDVPRHLYHFSPASMQRLVEINGLKLISCQPMWYDSFYISMLSSKYKNGKTNWAGACWNGLRSNWNAWNDPRKCSSLIYIIGK